MSTKQPAPGAKPWYLSKTFWLNAIALASMVFPPVREWLAGNPVEAAAALGAVNLLLRFVTRDAISLSKDDGGTTTGSGVSRLLMMLLAAGALCALLPSCSVVGSAVTGRPIPSIGVSEHGAKNATVVRVATFEWREAEAETRGVEAAGPMGNPTVYGLYDAGRAADAVRGVFTEPSK